ncbi:MAG: lipoprotein signal peptidase LspA [Saliniramus fredricksonii]|uniref:Lipoprotein signal peptidase n=1 Tax=Saliniramus fredricksonii TaxID=1653334 RepID=A0A0P7XAQ1_9HYPH|nr:signal peptidase II [Saliniramus fredricksonii]KPQ12358.1 MAG: lipoprotein signal peptidase LspA [Saliniramus fredricksonii]SCC81260.1 signal peptidase II [Saliniramus fredricksonii]
MSAARLSILVALVILALDQATKLYLLFVFELFLNEPVRLGPFVELITVWNRGISYGLLQQETELGRWGLVVFSLAAALGLGIWMLRTPHRFLAIALALIVGGAIGNAIDRIAYGAVFDFVHVFHGSFSWYVFNVADAAIVAGVLGLVYDSFVLEPRRSRAAEREDVVTPSHDGRDSGSSG